MKPTRGRVSSQPAREGWLGLSVYGGLARTVADSALLLDVLHGALPGDIYEAPEFTGSYVHAAATPPGRLRIATSRKLPPGFLARRRLVTHCFQIFMTMHEDRCAFQNSGHGGNADKFSVACAGQEPAVRARRREKPEFQPLPCRKFMNGKVKRRRGAGPSEA